MSPGTRRNGNNKFGPFTRAASGDETRSGLHVRRGQDHEYTGRHASPRRKTARTRAGKVVPAAAAAATLAAGAAAFTLGGGSPQAPEQNAALARPGTASAADIGKSHASASTLINASAPAVINAVTTARASVSHSGTQAARHTAPSTGRAAPSAPAATPHTASALSCDLNYSMLPQNVTAIVSFLLAHGYSHNAVAGIAGNIYQESKGDPEAVGMGGGGLIGWTPLRYGLVTGNPAADLQTQLAAVLSYNEVWSSYLPALNSAASPAAAADIYVYDFERAGIPAAGTREASAANVARACGL